MPMDVRPTSSQVSLFDALAQVDCDLRHLLCGGCTSPFVESPLWTLSRARRDRGDDAIHLYFGSAHFRGKSWPEDPIALGSDSLVPHRVGSEHGSQW